MNAQRICLFITISLFANIGLVTSSEAEDKPSTDKMQSNKRRKNRKKKTAAIVGGMAIGGAIPAAIWGGKYFAAGAVPGALIGYGAYRIIKRHRRKKKERIKQEQQNLNYQNNTQYGRGT